MGCRQSKDIAEINRLQWKLELQDSEIDRLRKTIASQNDCLAAQEKVVTLMLGKKRKTELLVKDVDLMRGQLSTFKVVVYRKMHDQMEEIENSIGASNNKTSNIEELIVKKDWFIKNADSMLDNLEDLSSQMNFKLESKIQQNKTVSDDRTPHLVTKTQFVSSNAGPKATSKWVIDGSSLARALNEKSVGHNPTTPSDSEASSNSYVDISDISGHRLTGKVPRNSI
jgi:hypothetical protein